MTDLGNFGGNFTQAWAINNSSQIVGQGFTDETQGPESAFFYSSTGTMTVIPTTLGGTSSAALGINNSGQIAGTADLPPVSGTAIVHAALLSPTGTITDLGTLGGASSYAHGINSAGQVVGFSYTTGNVVTAGFLYSGGVMTNIGSLGGTNTSADAINDAGQIVGSSAETGDSIQDAFLYSSGTMTSLGTLGGTSADALAINNSGQIVGNSTLSGTTVQDAFLYTDGTMKDLNTLFASLLVTGTGTQTGFTTLTTANDINNSGEIVGTGNYWNGTTLQAQGFLLQTAAVPEPSTWGLLLVGVGLLSFGRFRRYYAIAASNRERLPNT